MDSYEPLIEEKIQGFLEEEYQKEAKEMSATEICKMIGMHLEEDSFLYWAIGGINIEKGQIMRFT